MAEQHDSRL